MGATYYTSDLHVGHRFVAKLRGFETSDEHDAALAEAWHAIINDDDIVWVLGDIAMNGKKGLEFCAKLPGRKQLIAGNHDDAWPGHRDSWKAQRKWLAVFESVQPFAKRKVNGVEFLMSHFPYTADRDKVRYPQYRLRDEGAFLLHGHTHSDQRVTSSRELHVGIDAWGLAPIQESVILDYLSALPKLA